MKRKKKKEAKTKRKNRMRLALGMNETSVDLEAQHGMDDEELFNVSVAKTKADVDLIQNVALDDKMSEANRVAMEEAATIAEAEVEKRFPQGRPPSMRPDVEAADSDEEDSTLQF